ncbi:MAG TPA: nicotinamidase [Dehalococcoidia bacterium]|nr:nicotinamidase [Dehalococcoidia bacterium]
MDLDKTDALIVTDVQNDFCPGGSLGVPEGDRIAARMTEVAKSFQDRGARIFATQDWHPTGHSSFQEQDGPWPIHCVQGSHGADFHPNLHLPEGTVVIRKGSDPKVDAYSGFLDSDLDQRLKEAGVRRLFVGGIATEYCVLNTVLDAIKNGFEAVVLEDVSAAINVNPGDEKAAYARMREAGATVTTSSEVLGAPVRG